MEKWDHNKDIHRNDNGSGRHGDGVCGGKTNRLS